MPATSSEFSALPTTREAHRIGAFALRLTGNALAPTYRNGDLLHVDPAAPAVPGAVVVARLDGPDGPTAAMLLNADGDLLDNRDGYAARGTFTLLGVVVGTLDPEEVHPAT